MSRQFVGCIQSHADDQFSYPLCSTARTKALLKIIIVKMHLTPWQTLQMFEWNSPLLWLILAVMDLQTLFLGSNNTVLLF